MCLAFVPLSSYLPRLLYQSISTKLYFIFTPMSNQRNTKRKRATGPMIVGEVDSAQVVTPKTIYKTHTNLGITRSTIILSCYPRYRKNERKGNIEPRTGRVSFASTRGTTHISGRHTITKSIFIAKYSSSRHNVVICSSSSTAWTNFSRLYCRVRQCWSMPEHATFVTNQLRFGDVGNASHPD